MVLEVPVVGKVAAWCFGQAPMGESQPKPLGFRTRLCHQQQRITQFLGFPGGAVVENLPANAGDMGSSPGLGRSHMPRSN